MRILLINSSLKQAEIGHYSKTLEKCRGIYQPLGLGYISASLISDGHIVDVLDWDTEEKPLEKLFQLLERNPEVVCFYLMTWTFREGSALLDYIKTFKKDIISIAGGPQVSSFPSETLELSQFDFSIQGEAEYTIKELINAIKFNLKLDDINGLIWRGNGIIVNKPRKLEDDLDKLPFPTRWNFPIEKYNDVFTINHHFATLIASRGCPYQCIFCDRKNRMGSTWRVRSPQNIIQEMEHINITYGIKEFMFFDDNFIVEKKWVIDFCAKVEPYDFKWECRARVDKVDRQLLRILHWAGCYRIRYGMESGDDEILKILRKDITVEQIRECAKLTKEARIEIFAYFMMGSPFETPETMQRTIDLAMEIDADFTLFSRTILIPGSEMFNWAVIKNYIDKNYWLNFLKGIETNPAPVLPIPQADEFIKKANRQFYLRPSYIFNRLRKIKSFNQFYKQVKMGKAFL